MKESFCTNGSIKLAEIHTLSLYLSRVHERIFSAFASESGFKIRLLVSVIYTELVFGGAGNVPAYFTLPCENWLENRTLRDLVYFYVKV